MNPGEFEESDFSDYFDYLETKYSPNMDVGNVLVESESPHDENWFEKRDFDFNYWNDYEDLLIEEEWSPKVVGALNTVTDKVLGLLPDPQDPRESWYRRGLVLGHVQSGKTANYIGVISKAADAGYKFIIVIAGIHNNLRKQTQQRVDEGFIGRDSLTNEPLGVGRLSPNRIRPINLTDTDKDFDKTVRVPLELKHTDKPIVIVIKKNVNTLSNLYTWLKKLNTTEGFERIADTPVLMIDDEADNASINTNKPELDPTRTNKELRNILNLFNKRAYLAYTATPFANIFINPENKDDLYGDDLFPKDFIYCLDAPTNYFGSEKIFLDEEKSEQVVKIVQDAHLHLPVKQKKGVEVDSLPNSLIEAIYLFALATTIRHLRGQKNKHSSMLINVHIVTDVQRQVKFHVDDELRTLKNCIKFNCKKSLEEAEKDSSIELLKTIFNTEYSDAGFEWSEVLPAMGDTVDGIKTFMVNSQSEDRLDYSEYDKNNESVSAIAIGGLSLSRGLTVEGLTVSYIFRNSKMYDTLLQMGRWFGYRVDYEDLCRIYMTEDSLGWYTHISEVAEELRAQLKRMRRDGKSPIDFGLQVRAHPDTLIVTALNKMRHAESRAIEISFLGTLSETFIVPDNIEKNTSNHSAIENLFSNLISTDIDRVIDKTGSHCFYNVTPALVEDFVRGFNFHSGMIELKDIMPDFIRKTVTLFPDWDILFKSPRSGEKGLDCMGSQ
ncbi:MAG: Z1 domain-containing protein, partial [Cycloclasticus sp.]|nr:Z1 domain-containing protein [Cycloclasticus sp.]